MITAGFDIAQENETWKQIPGFEDYSVSNFGRVMRSLSGDSNAAQAGKILKPTFGGASRGYDRVTLYRDGQPTFHSVHRLVLLAFVGPPPTPDHLGAHNDGDTRHNRPENLRWALPKENSADMLVHGTALLGSDHPNSQLTPEQVNAIRRIHAAGVPASWIAAAVGIGESTTRRIVRGQSYK